jgi:FkbM family methyltransferase
MSILQLRREYEAGAITKHQFIHQTYSFHRQLFDYVSFVRDTNVRAIEITEEGVVLDLRDPPIRMYCPPGDERHIALETLNLKTYETGEFDMVCRLFEGGNFFDIGANAGYYSLGIASRFPSASISAFEPVPASYGQLCRNIALNGVSNITAHNIGLSDHGGELTFYHDASVSAATSSARPERGGDAQEIVSRMDTLDDFVTASQCEPDFIKCDVEGAELFVFLGGRGLLERRRPVVFAEMLRKWALRFGYHPNDIIRLFTGLGYGCYSILDEGLLPVPEVTEATVETNFFFLHERQHGPLLERVVRK